MTLATTDYYKNSEGEKVKLTEWHNLIAWGNKAENMSKFLKKGSEVAVQGKLIHRNYEGPDGKKRYISEIIADEILLLGKAQPVDAG